MDELVNVIEQNDDDLKKREDLLIKKVNHAYAKGIEKMIKNFRYLMKLNPNIKPSSKQVAKILDTMIKEFNEEMAELVEPFQRELVKQYEEGLNEAGTILAFRETQGKAPEDAHQD